jgi:hypothetical protein
VGLNAGWWVYVLVAPEVGRLKVGMTGNWYPRIAAIRASSPCEIKVMARVEVPDKTTALSVEATVEAFLRAEGLRSHGSWYDADPAGWARALSALEAAEVSTADRQIVDSRPF